jgi:hypothetical protein
MLWHLTGTRSGRVHVVPVGRHEHHGQLGSPEAQPRGGAALELTIDGRRRRAEGELVDDPEVVAEIFGGRAEADTGV